MKKIFQLLLVASIIYTGESLAQSKQTKTTNNWTAEDRTGFVAECLTNATPVMGEDSARMYCFCMQEKVEKKYPKVTDAAAITDATLNSPIWKKEIASCFLQPWTEANRVLFLSNCKPEAEQNLGKERGDAYCECMLYKLEVAYPDPLTITEEAMQSKEWDAHVQDCLKY